MALLVLNTPRPTRRYELTETRTEIGRLACCHIQLDETRISKHHAEIVNGGEEFTVRDLESRNHTFVNGEDIFGRGPRLLRDGDQVVICDFCFTFLVEDRVLDESNSAVLYDEGDIASSSSIALSIPSGQTPTDPRLVALLELTRGLKSALDLDSVLTRTLDSLCRVFASADRAFIGLLGAEGFELKWWTAPTASSEQPIRVSKTIVTRVLDSQQAIHFEGIQSQFPMADSVRRLPIRSALCAPLIDGDSKSFGVIQVDSTNREFHRSDLEVLASVAVQVALAINYAKMHEIAVQHSEIEKELEIARQVQNEFLPDRSPAVEGYEFCHFYASAKQIGGDYYDYLELPDGRIAVVVADVCGKGIPAALFMMRLATETRACLEKTSTPSEVLALLSRRFTSRFVTLVLAVVDPILHCVTIASAGHKSPFLRKRDGSILEPGKSLSGLPFSTEVFDYEQESITLEPRESLTFYTDGIDEARSSDGERLGHGRISKIIQRDHDSARDQVMAIVDGVHQFVGDGAQSDDMCIVSVRRS